MIAKDTRNFLRDWKRGMQRREQHVRCMPGGEGLKLDFDITNNTSTSAGAGVPSRAGPGVPASGFGYWRQDRVHIDKIHLAPPIKQTPANEEPLTKSVERKIPSEFMKLQEELVKVTYPRYDSSSQA